MIPTDHCMPHLSSNTYPFAHLRLLLSAPAAEVSEPAIYSGQQSQQSQQSEAH